MTKSSILRNKEVTMSQSTIHSIVHLKRNLKKKFQKSLFGFPLLSEMWHRSVFYKLECKKNVQNKVNHISLVLDR